MQAIAERSSASPRLIAFPTRMAAQNPIPQTPPPLPVLAPTWWQQHGTTATWIAIAVTCVIGLSSIATTWHFRHVDADAKSADEHINTLIDTKLGPAIDKINDHTDKKVGPISEKIDSLSDRVSRIEGRLDKRVSALENGARQQISLAKLMDPSRVLATIRAELKIAEGGGKILPASDLEDYKNAVRALPVSASEYWTTTAAIINYQSLINEMSGEAPDPSKVSKNCGFGPATFNNRFEGTRFGSCQITLDKNAFVNVVFKDSVITYRGGPTLLSNVTFINCRFVLKISGDGKPASPALLFTLLDSSTQKTVKVD